MVLHDREEMALACTVVTTNELRVGVSIILKLSEELILGCEPPRVANMQVANAGRD
jgi:hypothetical protein